MVNLESKRLPVVPKEVTYDHPLFLRGASPDEIREIIELDPQIVKTDQQKSILFVQKLLEAGFIGINLSYWNGLKELYSRKNRDSPEEFVMLLRLEAFFRARVEIQRGDDTMLQMFIKIGTEIDRDWFYNASNPTYKSEQAFIRDALYKEKNTRNGNNAGVGDVADKLEYERVKVYGEELARILRDF